MKRAHDVKGGPPPSTTSLLWLFVLIAATAAAYHPAWQGGLLWDDDAHLTREGLRSWSGLVSIWTDFSATPQYYPVVNSAFWLMHRLWGDATLGYHLVNILLHASSSFLVIVILRRIGAAGAALAGVIFALHPVHVESVAWMTELKNCLSGFWYLAALLIYLRFDETRTRSAYAVALGLFVLALGSKTVTATFPAAMLVIFWWRRGRIDWRRDAGPLVPFFVLGIASGILTAWVEYHHVGAHGEAFELGVIDRLLVAGRVVWFYAAKLAWPVNLIFSYPRWTIDAGVWWQYLFPMALIAVLAGLTVLARRTRAPLACALFFIGTLVPVLGFLNVYPFRFSFVADHFQYLASLGLIALAAAGLVRLAQRIRPRGAEAALALLVLLIGVPLGVLTREQSREYVGAETQYRATLAKNPRSSLAANNLSVLLLDGPAIGWAEGVVLAGRLVASEPRNDKARNQLGLGLQKFHRHEEAVAEFREAIRLAPRFAEAHYNLGLSLDELRRPEDAVAAYEASLAIHPANAKALHNLANVLRRLRRHDEAVRRIREAARLSPGSLEIRLNLADTLLTAGATDEAIAAYREAIALSPDSGEGWNNLGLALNKAGRSTDAIDAFERAMRLLPGAALPHMNLASVLSAVGRFEAALPHYEHAIALTSGEAAARLHTDAGAILVKLGRKAEAAAHFDAAARIRR